MTFDRHFSKPLTLKLYLFEFHENFDILLGNDILKSLFFKTDYQLGTVQLWNLKFNFKLQKEETVRNALITIQPQCDTVIEVPIENVQNGTVLIPEIQFSDTVHISQGLATVKNGKAKCQVTNNSEKPYNLIVHNLHAETISDEDLLTSAKPDLFLQRHKKDFDKIRHSHMSLEERLATEKLIKQFPEIIPLDDEPLTFGHTIKHKINTKDELPCYTKNYRYPHALKNEVFDQVRKMLEQGIIRPSYSPWSSPVWIVPKKLDASGKQKWRVVIDYRKVNDKTIGDKYPIPNITDVLDRLGRAKYFTTLDLASGFHQIEMDEESIPKTAFSIEQGHFEFVRMPFGLKNAPPTFQRVMDNILRGYINKFCLVYLDDILIFSSSLQEHALHCKLVFQRLKEFNMKIQLDKSEFFRKEVGYLGHIITADGVKPNPAKIEAITKFEIPKTPKDIKSFLGLLGYYRRFIHNMADLTKPLTSKLKKNQKIDIHDEEYRNCFEKCKKILCNDPILAYPDFNEEFILTTDASNVGVGAVLSQKINDVERPVCYASRTLNETEQKLSTTEKECLAIMYGVAQFRPYLFGRKFKIFTDHQPLKWLFNLKEPNAKLMRWKLRLEEYDFEIFYKPGKTNQNADALSRNPVAACNALTIFDLDNQSMIAENGDENDENVLDEMDALANLPNPEILDINPDIELPDLGNDIFDEVNDPEPPQNNIPENSENEGTIHSNQSNYEIVEIPIVDSPVNYAARQIIIKNVRSENPDPDLQVTRIFNKTRVVVHLPAEQTEEFIIKTVKTYCYPTLKYGVYFEHWSDYQYFQTIIQGHFTRLNWVRYTKLLTDVEDEIDQLALCHQVHDSMTNHRGILENLTELKDQYYWPNMKETVTKVVNNCELCQLNKYERRPNKMPFEETPTPTEPFEHLFLDLFSIAKKWFLTAVDSFSKYAIAFPLNSRNAIAIVEKLEELFSTFPIPKLITFDSGSEFQKLVKECLQIHRINVHFTSVGHHSSNGDIERLHSTLIEHCRLLKAQPEFSTLNITRIVHYALVAYNESYHSTIKAKPKEILFPTNRLLRDPIKLKIGEEDNVARGDRIKKLYDLIRNKILTTKETVLRRENQNRTQEACQIPARVYYKTNRRNKLASKFQKGKNRGLLPRNRSKVENEKDKKLRKVHAAEIRPKRKYVYSVSGSGSD